MGYFPERGGCWVCDPCRSESVADPTGGAPNPTCTSQVNSSPLGGTVAPSVASVMAVAAPGHGAAVTVHGHTWTKQEVTEPVGGPVSGQAWSVRTLPRDVICEEGDCIDPGTSLKPYDCLMAILPMD